mgnify:CR=1 FL=1
MITIQIDEKKMSEMLAEALKGNINETLESRQVEYWVRGEVHEILAEEIIEKTIKPMLTKEYVKELLIESFDRYISNRFTEKGWEE